LCNTRNPPKRETPAALRAEQNPIESGLAQEPDGEVRHHPGIPGGIIPLYPGVFVGIRNVEHV
jgi:hypothetical protein